jgi:hypothetical protein
MARPATTKHLKNWNMGSDCKISCHARRFPHNMAVQNWWTCPAGSFQSNMFKKPDVHPKLHPREALSRYFETFFSFFLLIYAIFNLLFLGFEAQTCPTKERCLKNILTHGTQLHHFQVQFISCFQLQSSVDPIEDDSYDFAKFTS